MVLCNKFIPVLWWRCLIENLNHSSLCMRWMKHSFLKTSLQNVFSETLSHYSANQKDGIGETIVYWIVWFYRLCKYYMLYLKLLQLFALLFSHWLFVLVNRFLIVKAKLVSWHVSRSSSKLFCFKNTFIFMIVLMERNNVNILTFNDWLKTLYIGCEKVCLNKNVSQRIKICKKLNKYLDSSNKIYRGQNSRKMQLPYLF